MKHVKLTAALLAMLAIGLSTVRYCRLESARSRASRFVAGLDGRIGSITPPIPLAGSEYIIALPQKQFTAAELDRFAELRPLIKHNYVIIKFDPNIDAVTRMRVAAILPGIRILSDEAVRSAAPPAAEVD